ncbi:unnamed protein product [Acanthoscelides obtectus]|uniref:Uncharacterized protein n=1 Tax=Acanthoscelides obtectus TaxID=200917 RepID=A0A9P0KUP7_ACAOB|nr:unnamed protein product [Acanthoscelides obtectus]CAK1660093.1 Putative uncharacterized protein YAL004W [Acanthoscelides obtectus]
MTRWSKSSPPRWVSPLVATTSNTPLSIVRRDTSKVPPPKSNTKTFFSPSFLSKPYAMAAAVGSLMIRITLSLSIIEVSWHSHNSVGNLLPQVRFGSLLHLAEDHSGDFLGGEHLGALTGFHLDVRFAVLLDDLEGEQFDVMLDVSVVEFATNQTLRVEDGVFRIGCQLILGCVTDQTFTVRRERYVRGGDPVTLVVCYYLHSPVLVYTHAVKVMVISVSKICFLVSHHKQDILILNVL